jgi:hypothetical protein
MGRQGCTLEVSEIEVRQLTTGRQMQIKRAIYVTAALDETL